MTFTVGELIRFCSPTMARILMREFRGLKLERLQLYLYKVTGTPD